MKDYHSIDGKIIKGSPFYAQAKYDGSNLRAKWQPKKGFCLFGSRTQLIDETNPLGKGIGLFRAKYEQKLHDIFKANKFEEVVCFFEFYGPSSFAGVHDYAEIGHDVVLFDINVHKKGLIHPKEFYKLLKDVPVAELLYHGNITDEFVESVKSSTLEGMPFEGCVCKGAPLKNGYPPHAFKIKSDKWIEKVKSMYFDPDKLKELL
jgi:hypothetical protein